MNHIEKSALVLGLALCSAPAFAEDSWQFRLSPYMWFAGLEGDVATIPGAPAAPINISPKEALDDTEVGVMFLFEGKKGRHGFLADFIYTDVRSDEELIPPPIGLELRSKTKSTIFSLAYQYELYNQNDAVVDLLAGARYWRVDSELRFAGGLGILAGRRVSNKESWVDPGLGIKGQMPLGNTQFFIAGGAVVGGFGVGSDLFYELHGDLGYQWSKTIGTSLGYRMFDVDYDNDGFLYDVRQEGWELGLTWAF